MCVVSFVSDYGVKKVFPDLTNTPNVTPFGVPNLWQPNTPLSSTHQIITLTEYNELLRKAKEFDEKTGQSDCPDPEKMAKVEEFCKKFEQMGVEMFRLAHELRDILKK